MIEEMKEEINCNEDLVRDVADKKKRVFVHRIKVKNITCKLRRKKEELKLVKDLLKSFNDEEVK